jgi:hypothetical protein
MIENGSMVDLGRIEVVLLFDMIEKIRKAVNDDNFLVGAKVTMYEGMPGGQGHAGPDSPLIDLTESIDLVKGCEERGASFFH